MVNALPCCSPLMVGLSHLIIIIAVDVIVFFCYSFCCRVTVIVIKVKSTFLHQFTSFPFLTLCYLLLHHPKATPSYQFPPHSFPPPSPPPHTHLPQRLPPSRRIPKSPLKSKRKWCPALQIHKHFSPS